MKALIKMLREAASTIGQGCPRGKEECPTYSSHDANKIGIKQKRQRRRPKLRRVPRRRPQRQPKRLPSRL